MLAIQSGEGSQESTGRSGQYANSKGITAHQNVRLFGLFRTQLTVVEIIEAKKEVDQTEYKVTDAKPKRVLLRNKNEVKQQNSEQNKKIAVCEMEKTKS